VDEEHPTCTTDPYSFSKQVLETIGDYFWRREGISSVSLRLPAVYEVSATGHSLLRDFVSRARRETEAVLALPDSQRGARVGEILRRIGQLGAERHWEQPLADYGMRMPDAPIIFGRNNFWTSIDARDSAQAIEGAVLAEYEGSHSLFVNDRHNFVGIASETLAKVFFPDVDARKHELSGSESLVSVRSARELIGFEPKHSVEDWQNLV
jgi:nucleoside-diphosphate-sugar epimerase